MAFFFPLALSFFLSFFISFFLFLMALCFGKGAASAWLFGSQRVERMIYAMLDFPLFPPSVVMNFIYIIIKKKTSYRCTKDFLSNKFGHGL